MITRPKLKKYFKIKEVDQFLDLIQSFSELVNVTSQVRVCRDPNDDFLLALAKDSKAHFLVTGDNDLLEMNKFERTRIISISDFKKLL